jgi:hypothetical protein
MTEPGDHFCAVSSEAARVLNDWGSVSHSLGAHSYLSEGRLTAFHQVVAERTR